MMEIEDTSRRHPIERLLGSLDGTGQYVTGLESAGQRQLVESTKLPTRGSDALVELGFVLGDIDPRDPLFREVTLPAGWSRQASGHPMGSYVVDELGRRRVEVFYKAAPYDRRADCRVLPIGDGAS